MAPALIETPFAQQQISHNDYKEFSPGPSKFDKKKEATATYQNYLPTWNPEETYAPLQPFEVN